MKTARLVIGIISMVLFMLITLQSCAAGTVNTLSGNGEVSGTAGFLLAVCMLIAGIVGVCCRRIKTGTIVSSCFYDLGGIIAISNVGSYSDLLVWGILSLTFGLVFYLTAIWQDEDPLY